MSEMTRNVECIGPTPLTPDEISTVLDGKATTDTQAHLELCESCLRRVLAARVLEAAIQDKMHPTPEQLVAYASADLDAPEQKQIEIHLRYCHTCRKELEATQDFLRETESDLELDAALVPNWNPQTVTASASSSGGFRDRGGDKHWKIRDDALRIDLSIFWKQTEQHLEGQIFAQTALEDTAWLGAIILQYHDAALENVAFVGMENKFEFDDLPDPNVTLFITNLSGQRLTIELKQ